MEYYIIIQKHTISYKGRPDFKLECQGDYKRMHIQGDYKRMQILVLKASSHTA